MCRQGVDRGDWRSPSEVVVRVLDDVAARDALPPRQGWRPLYDSVLRGFLLKVSSPGTRAWCVLAPSKTGRSRTPQVIGHFPSLSAVEARKLARTELARI